MVALFSLVDDGTTVRTNAVSFGGTGRKGRLRDRGQLKSLEVALSKDATTRYLMLEVYSDL